MARYQQFLDAYKKEYGLQKFRKINNHISNSGKTKNLIQEAVTKNIYPYGRDIVETVLSHFRYSFASSETVLAASVIILKRLVEKMKETSDPLKDHEIRRMEKQIVNECQEI